MNKESDADIRIYVPRQGNKADIVATSVDTDERVTIWTPSYTNQEQGQQT